MRTLRTSWKQHRYALLLALALGSPTFLSQMCSAQAVAPTPSPAVGDSETIERRNFLAKGADNYVTDISLWNWRDLEGPVKVSICSTKPRLGMSEPVFLLVAVHNSSADPRLVVNTWPPYMFSVSMEGRDGKEIPKTRLGDSLDQPTYFSRYAVQLDPGDTLGYVLDLRWIYDLSLPGLYRVQVKIASAALDANTQDEAKSNRLEFEIVKAGLPGIDEMMPRP